MSMRTLKDLGKIVTGNTPKMSERENFDSADIPFIKPGDISDDSITVINKGQFFISENARDKARILPSDSILVTCIGIIGKVGILTREAAFNQQINGIVPDINSVIPRYLAYAILSQKSYLQEKANAAVVPIINKSQFSELKVEVPNLQKQNEIVRNLDKVDHLISLQKQQLKGLDELVKSQYAERTKCSKANLDNIRRILSSFFTWLEDESYILKNPVRRIHKIRVDRNVKETYSDEAMERMRDECHSLRDLAIIDLLASSGMRVGELVHLNREDIDFENRECIVFGKGSKERPVYFDARTKIHLKNYLDSRTDDNPALFVSLLKPYNRLQISGVEIRLRSLGRELGIPKVHPHKFRRTLATRAIDKGMPIEQVQRLLGHTQIDTTMQYAMINQKNVKVSHQKYIA